MQREAESSQNETKRELARAKGKPKEDQGYIKDTEREAKWTPKEIEKGRQKQATPQQLAGLAFWEKEMKKGS